MSRRYGILGAGRQGTAAAYDVARFDAEARIDLADVDLGAAERAARRVNALAQREAAAARALDVADREGLRDFLSGVDVCLSATPYRFNAAIARVAVEAGCSMCDLGGNTQIVHEELALDAAARAAGIAIVPDCGVGPGMIANLAVHAIEQFDRADEVLIYDGGLPENPRPPFNYTLPFNIAGLTNEYAGDALYLVDGKIRPTACFEPDEYERVRIPELGELEAFTTSGGLSTMARTYEGRLKTLKNKTLRYPGHYALFKGLADLGFLGEEAIDVAGERVVPREVLHALAAPRLAPRGGERDLMAIHIRARGIKEGREAEVRVDMLDRFDEATGFSAMERTTGYHGAIVMQAIARGEIGPGAWEIERAIEARRMVEELARRGIEVKSETSVTSSNQ